VGLSVTNGTLAPFSSTEVTASINAEANRFPPGTYAATVSFLNTSTGAGGTSRKMTLKTHPFSTISSLGYDDPNGPPLQMNETNFRVTSEPGNTCVVQASTNLVNWTPRLTNTVPRTGFFDFRDERAARFEHRFYRAVSSAGGPVLLDGDDAQNDRLLIKPRSGLNLSLLHILLGTSVLQTSPVIGNLQIVSVPEGAVVESLLAVFRQSGLVEYAEPDFQGEALVEPNDSSFVDGSLWNLHNTGQGGGAADADIDAPEGWDAQNTAEHVVVAVIDTGVRYTHEDLAANIWVNPDETAGNGIDDDGNGYTDDVHGINAIINSGDPNDDHGHGTHVSGIVGGVGNNRVGVVGVCWRVQIMACKFLEPSGNGLISDAIKCIDYARSKGADVINTSWGSPTFNSAALRDAFDSARQAGIIVTAAAGNSAESNDTHPLYPASYDLENIISVAATTRTDGLAAFSNYGATTVDVAAPASRVFSCWNGSDSDYRYLDGTSMAAPHVAGTCALVRARYRQ